MNGFALDTNIVSAHLRGDVQVGTMIKATTRLYLSVTVLGELFYGSRDAHFDSVEGLRKVRRD